jgi:hypothetical protein
MTGSCVSKLLNTNSGTDLRIMFLPLRIKKFLQVKAVEATNQKGEKKKKPKPEEQEGMPQRQHCPHAKRREDRNPDSCCCTQRPQRNIPLLGYTCTTTDSQQTLLTTYVKFSYKKKQWRPPSKKKKRGKNLSPRRNRKACHSTSTALLKSVALALKPILPLPYRYRFLYPQIKILLPP